MQRYLIGSVVIILVLCITLGVVTFQYGKLKGQSIGYDNVVIQFDGSVSQYPIPVKNGFLHVRVTGNVVTLSLENK